MLIRRLACEDQGQTLVEFGLTIGIFMAFLYGLLGLGLWGTSAFLVQEAAHSAARNYAGTLDEGRACAEADVFLKQWAFPFIESHTISVLDDGQSCTVTVAAVPRPSIRKLFIFQEDSINRQSNATLDYALRYKYQFTGD